MKKFIRILIFVAIWAAITWKFRDHLLPLPRPDEAPPPHFRTPEHAAAPATGPKPAPEAASEQSTSESSAQLSVAPDPGDDLTAVKGIGPVYSERLMEMGISSFSQLAKGDASAISDRVDVAESVAEDWIRQASDLAG